MRRNKNTSQCGGRFHARLCFWLSAVLLIAMLMTASQALALSRTQEKALSLRQIIQIALQNNKNLRAAKYNVAIAQARWVQAGLFPNPTLEVAHSNDHLFNDEGEYETTAGFTQNFSYCWAYRPTKKGSTH